MDKKGFTLIELMITIAIIGIIAAIAIPSYIHYTRRAYYSEVVQATGPYKLGITECFHNLGTLTGCSGGSSGVPNDKSVASGAVATVVAVNGVVTVTPVASHGILATDTYILTPTVEDGVLVWASSGGGVTSGYAN